MPSRLTFALLIGAMLSACSLTPGQNATTVPQATSAPTTAATNPTNAPSAATSEPTAAAATTVPTEPNATTTATTAKYERGDCKFTKPQGVDVECGVLTVPENRTKDNGRTVRLAVGIFKTASKSPKPDPIVYLEGGPGGNALENWSQAFERLFGPIAGDRDFIIFDQRGTGYSEPSLACKEDVAESYNQLDKQYSNEEGTQRSVNAFLQCHDRLAKEGVDFTAYNSVESAADMNDLRLALGYKEWNVYGISYGTRLALTAMREHPEGTRSVIIDSVVPLQASETDTPKDADRAFNKLFDGCAADAACAKAYPNLKETFFKTVDQLNAKPVKQTYTDPQDNKTYDILITGDKLVGALFFSLYQTSAIPLMPRMINDAATGADYTLLTQLIYQQASQSKDISTGMLYTVRCNEEIPFDTPQALADADKPYPEQRGLFDTSSYTTICNAWNAGKAPDVENQPVMSDIPTLVMSGEYDPVTPPAGAQDAAKTLARSFFVEFPGYGHGTSIDGQCPISIVTAFLDKPTDKPDTSCINDLKGPAFAVPEGPITLKPFESQNAGVKGVVPDSWEKISDQVYANRSGDSIILQVATGSAKQETLNLVTQQFKLTNVTATGEHKSANHTWSLYTVELQGQPAELGLTEAGGGTLIVLVSGPKAERQKLYDTLFIPALDALQPLG